jgi:hypothetical protein
MRVFLLLIDTIVRRGGQNKTAFLLCCRSFFATLQSAKMIVREA